MLRHLLLLMHYPKTKLQISYYFWPLKNIVHKHLIILETFDGFLRPCDVTKECNYNAAIHRAVTSSGDVLYPYKQCIPVFSIVCSL